MRSFVFPAEYHELSPADQKLVYRSFIHPMLTRFPILLSRWGVNVAILSLGGFSGGFASTERFVVLMVAWLVADRFFEALLLRRKRAEVVRFISDARRDGRLPSHA